MPLVTTKKMFEQSYRNGYAIGAFNVNDMEIIQGIVNAGVAQNAPLILQVSAGARKYADPVYLRKLVEAAVETSGLPIALHLDHGDSFDLCKSCIENGFTSVMIDASKYPLEENIRITREVVNYAHDHGVVVEAELGKLAGIEDAVKVSAKDAQFTDPDEVYEFATKTGIDSLAIAIGTSHGAYKFKPGTKPPAALRYSGRSGKAPPRLPHRFARRVFRPAGSREGHQQLRRPDAGRDRNPRRNAPPGGEDGGLQDQHRLRPARRLHGGDTQALCRRALSL